MTIETPIRISTNAEDYQEESEFLGEVTADEISPGEFGPQYHLAVKPLNFAIAGKTGWFHEWAKISRHKRSKLGSMAFKFGQVFGANEFLGTGTMVGKRAWFVRTDIIFGTDRQTGEEMKAEQVLMPVRAMQPGDEALILPAGATAVGSTPRPRVETPTSFTDEEIDLLLSTIDGAPADRLAMVGARTNLPSNLKQAIMSGKALSVLTEQGLVMVDGDGKVVALAEGDPEPEPEPEPEPAAVRKPRFARTAS